MILPASPSKRGFRELPRLWSFPNLSGRIIEISGSGAAAPLTFAVALVVEAQRRGELVGWVTSEESSFYPPDAAEAGVDLDALTVVRAREAGSLPRAGEKLLRSGAFGLVVIDLGAGDVPLPLQSRLASLARRHQTALVFLTEKTEERPSLGSLISLRAHAERRRGAHGEFSCALEVLKDKRHGPAWAHGEVRLGPAGLR